MENESYLTLNLAGAFTCYPDPKPDGLVIYRNTLRGPEACGYHTVYGILEACLGYANTEEFDEDREALRMRIRIEEVKTETSDEHVMVDFQTVRSTDPEARFPSVNGGYKQDADRKPLPPAVKKKEYLTRARRRVRVYSDEETIQMLKNALRNPWYDPYIGRACCIPSEPLLVEEENA